MSLRGDFEAGLETGEWTVWFESGEISDQGPQVAGKPHGEWQTRRSAADPFVGQLYEQGLAPGK